MDDIIDSIIDYLSELDMPINSELIEHAIDSITDAAGNAIENSSELMEAVNARLAEIGENISRNAAIVNEGVEVDANTDLTAMFDNSDISFTGATEKDKAFQKFKQILSEHYQSIPYSKMPTFIGDSIGAASASNLQDYVRELFIDDKINADTENRLMELIDKMR